jgi:hypothetical protein
LTVWRETDLKTDGLQAGMSCTSNIGQVHSVVIVAVGVPLVNPPAIICSAFQTGVQRPYLNLLFHFVFLFCYRVIGKEKYPNVIYLSATVIYVWSHWSLS